MSTERYNILVREIVQYAKLQEVENIGEFLNDLKFDVLNLLYESSTDLQVVKRGFKVEPFSKEKLSENLAFSSDSVSDERIADVLDTEDILSIVDDIVDLIKKEGKVLVSSDEIVSFTKAYLKDNGYKLALEGYSNFNNKEGR